MILISGAGGFIGRQVCELLSAHGQPVLGFDRRFDVMARGSIVTGDIASGRHLAEVFQGHQIDAIVHLAAILNTASERQPERAARINIQGSLGLLNLAMKHGVKRFIYGSSISVYGPKPYAVHGAVSEAEPAAPSRIYGASKRYVEIAGENYAREGRLEFIALRISMVVGAGAVNTSTPWRSEIFEKLQPAGPSILHMPFAAEERLPLIHVADVAEIIGLLIRAAQPAHAIYNTPSENCTCGELAAILRNLNPRLDLTYSPSTGRGDPEAIDGSRFSQEFGFQAAPVEQRLRAAPAG